MDNRRDHPRYGTEVLTARLTSTSESIDVQARNISLGGVGLMTPRALIPGDQVTLCLYLKADDGQHALDREELLLSAQVAWCAPVRDGQHEAGIRFSSLDREQFSTLSNLLRSLQRTQSR
jgi:Tfp pilus assembly protein PilZ